MKIVFFETSAVDKKFLTELLEGISRPIFISEPLAENTAKDAADADIVSVMIESKITRGVIDKLKNVKLITTRSTGFDHIDWRYAATKDIAVASVPAYGSRTVAEFTFALILTLSRNIFDAYGRLRENYEFNTENLRGFDLQGKTLGVVGLGKIGRNVVRIAKGFDMNIIGCDKYPNKDFLKEYQFSCVELPDLLSRSDIVTLHVPYMKSTHHLINKDNFKYFKDGAYLINTSRGAVIDTEALLDALKSKKLSGAGLDVLEGERALREDFKFTADSSQAREKLKTIIRNHIFIDMPNVIVTPHVAFFSSEAERRIMKTTAENIKAFLNGRPQNIIS